MTQLDKDLKHVKANFAQWRALYDKEDAARTERFIKYLEELKKLEGDRK